MQGTRAWICLPIIFAAIIVIAFVMPARANNMPPQVKFERVLPNQIESIDYINSIVQDRDGYIWFGAIKGLVRYDGYRLKTFRADPDKKGSLSSSLINLLIQIGKGELWAVTAAGLCEYDPIYESFECIEKPRNAQGEMHFFSTMYQDSTGKVWVSSSMGLQLLDPDSHELLPAPSEIAQAIPPLPGTQDNLVHEIIEDNKGNLWFGLVGNGLINYNPATKEIIRFTKDNYQQHGLTGEKIRALLIDSKGVLWVGTLGGGVSFYDPNTRRFNTLEHSQSEKSKEIWDILEDDKGLLWIGDGDGVHIYDPETERIDQYKYEEGVLEGPGNFVVRDLFLDNAKGIWLGYFPSGIDKVNLQASQFQNYRHKPNDFNSLADGGVLTTLEDNEGNLWVGCGFGLSYLHRETQTFSRFGHDKNDPRSLSGSTILDMALQQDQTLWLGAWDRGLNRRDPKTGYFKRYTYDPNRANSLLGREPWALVLDDTETLWVGTELGFNRYRKESDDFEHFFPLDSSGAPLERLYIRKLYQDSNRTLWIGSFNGLYAFDIDSKAFVKHYTHDPEDPQSLSSNQVLSIYEDQQGDFWVGTSGGGLNLFDRQSGLFKRYDLEDGLPDMSVSGIVDDLQGHIWLSTFRGLARFDKQSQEFTAYEKRDGLLGNQYNRNSPSRLTTGELAFGSTRGLTIFNPASLKANSHVPPVVFTGFSIFNEPVLPGPDSAIKWAIGRARTVSLKHNQSVFSLEFAGLDFVAPEDNQYAYRLLGFEDSWNYVGNRRSATYTNLDPGSYSFQVQASNSNGIWNPKPASLKIVVSPPPWQTPLAYLIYALLAAGILARAWYVQRAKLAFERQKYEQERAVVKRLKELDQMKDEINRELDRKVAERTEALNQEHQRLIAAQEELQALNQKLEEASLTDPLTGLKNRRFLHQTIDEDLAYVLREYRNTSEAGLDSIVALNDISFLVLDVDKFKAVNDTFGHNAGDAVLVQLSEVIKQELRQSDFLIRWGGEEFVVVIRHLPRDKVPAIAERIRQAVKSHQFIVNGEATLTKTCSIGFASFPFVKTQGEAFRWEQVINVADKALFCAKSSGRDCWVGLEFNVEGASSPNEIANIAHAINSESINKEIQSGHLTVQSSKPVEDLQW